MEKTWFAGSSIAISGTIASGGAINLVRTRTVSITAKVKFHGSATGDVRVDLYYSPDGKNWDTVAYTTFDIAVSAGVNVQRTAIIDAPEHGYLEVRLVNEDATYATSEYRVWRSVQLWPPYVCWEHGARGEITTPGGD